MLKWFSDISDLQMVNSVFYEGETFGPEPGVVQTDVPCAIVDMINQMDHLDGQIGTDIYGEELAFEQVDGVI